MNNRPLPPVKESAHEGSKGLRGRTAEIAEGFLLWTVCAYIVVTFIRPQDMLPALGIVKPGWPITILVLAACAPHVWPQISASRIARAGFAFLGVMCVGLVMTVNQYWWFQTTWMHFVTTIVFLVGLPVLMKTEAHRNRIVILFMIAFWTLALWVLSHHGIGVGAFLQDENDTAVWLGVGVCFGAFMGIMRDGLLPKVLGWSLAVLSAWAIVVTNSRGGFVGLAVGTLGILWFSRRAIIGALAVGAIAALAFSHLPAGYIDKRLMSATDPNDETRVERLYSWHRAWDMFLDHPVVGVGAGNFAWRVGKYDSSEAAIQERKFKRSVAGRAAHSMYFQLLPETGVAGLLCYAVILMASLRIAMRVRRKDTVRIMDPMDRSVALAAAAGLIAMSASGAFVSVLFYPNLWVLCGLLSYIPIKYPELFSLPRRSRQQSRRAIAAAVGGEGGDADA
jgi:O-antigen ligase